MSGKTARTMAELMRNNVVIKYGAEKFPDLKICGKSGTAETGAAVTDALFAGFVDDSRYPLAFVVVVEDGGFGAQACIPIAARVLQSCKDLMDSQ
jgi:peptidoglycan glycosyltransferase